MKSHFMKPVAGILVVAVTGVGLSGCADLGISKESQGALLGGAAGGFAGYGLGTATGSTAGKVLLTLGGTFLGGFLGSRLGRQLDERDRIAMSRATQTTLETAPSGTPVPWKNPDTGHSGTVVARPAFETGAGRSCREFTQTFVVDERREKVDGTACRQPDGRWKVVR